MRTYERTKRGFNYTITSKGVEKLDPTPINLGGLLRCYIDTYGSYFNMNRSEVVRHALIKLFEQHDKIIIETEGFTDYLSDDYKSPEYIELYEKTPDINKR